MSDYTPTTENIRNCYVFSTEQYDGQNATPVPIANAEFDRWLAAHDAATAAKALEDAAVAVDNAERIAGAGYDHPNRSDVTEWLRARATAIRTQQEGTE